MQSQSTSYAQRTLDRLGIESPWLNDFSKKNKLFGFVLFLPALIFLAIFILLPIVYVFWISLHEMHLLATEGTFIGLGNYAALLTSPDVRSAFQTGIIYAVGSVSFQLLIGLFIALVLNREFVGSSVARTLAILPYLVPVITVVLMFRWITNPLYGILNVKLVSLGLVSEPINFFGDPTLAMPTLIVASSWKYISFCVLVFLARLQSIDDALYEQAKISGANLYQMFTTITLPNLWNAILLVVLLRVIWMFNKFGIIWLFTRGGPLQKTTTFPIYIYESTFLNYKLGLGSAGAILLFLVLAVVAAIYFWRFKPSQEIETTR